MTIEEHKKSLIGFGKESISKLEEHLEKPPTYGYAHLKALKELLIIAVLKLERDVKQNH